MLRRYTILVLCLFASLASHATRVSGLVTDVQGQPLAFASVSVKNGKGTITNAEGKYFLDLEPGNYTLVAAFVGYQKREQELKLEKDPQTITFRLLEVKTTLQDVVVKQGEDPAYAIIRKAIAAREGNANRLKSFSFEVYTKGLMRTRAIPKKFMGKKVDMEDGDTSQKKILYLSETISKVYVERPRNVKVDVVASKVSGDRDGYGLAAPAPISVYTNFVRIGSGLNPRGFVSPIADGALNYYRYKFMGTFYEDGVEISRIRVTPRRNYEPLFSGYISIVENSWNVHSTELVITKQNQMQLLDTLRLNQLYTPLRKDLWTIKTQVMGIAIKIFGFDVVGSFANSYGNFNTDEKFGPKFFNNTLLTYTDSSNKKTDSFWATTRPLELQADEARDYVKKDSLEQRQQDPKYLDSLDRRSNKLSLTGLLINGENFSRRSRRENFGVDGIIKDMVQFNTVEGWLVNLSGYYAKRLDTSEDSRRRIYLRPTLRYGFSNQRFNAKLLGGFEWGKNYRQALNVEGGRGIFQFNNANPVAHFANTFASLQWERNYLKIYEAAFARVAMSNGLGEGLTLVTQAEFQDRQPLENTTDYKWRDRKEVFYTANFPTELVSQNMQRHQAFVVNVGLNWRPGNRYIQYPNRKVSIGSRWPVFAVNYTQAFKGIAGSDVQYSKWRASVNDNMNLNLLGRFDYRLVVGGFLNREAVQIPDLTHFNGNQMLLAETYLNSFQLAPYYQYSNAEKFYTRLHVEHHFNGLLTNKIPGFKKLNWFLVMGANTFYVNRNANYLEAFVGLENIFKVLRVDFVQAFEAGNRSYNGVRIGFAGLLGNALQ